MVYTNSIMERTASDQGRVETKESRSMLHAIESNTYFRSTWSGRSLNGLVMRRFKSRTCDAHHVARVRRHRSTAIYCTGRVHLLGPLTRGSSP